MKKLKLLLVEDNPLDAELIEERLALDGYDLELRRVESESGLIEALGARPWDLVVTDYRLPAFDGLQANRVVRERMPDLPVILSSGTIGEERVVEALKAGVSDFVAKGNAERLAPAIERALRERDERIARREADATVARQNRRLRALREIDIAIGGSIDLRIVAGTVLTQVVTELDVDAATLLTCSRHDGRFDFVAAKGFAWDDLELRNAYDDRERPHCDEAVATRRPVFVRDLDASGWEFPRSPMLRGERFVAYMAVPLVAKGRAEGVLEIFHRGRLEPDEDWWRFLEALAGQAAIALDNAELYTDLERANSELRHAYDKTLEGWVHALDVRDKETEGHSQRVTSLTVGLARRLEFPTDDLVHIRRGALLHDIGKMAIPDAILHKPGPLTDDEWVEMRKHPVHAMEWLTPIRYLQPAIDIPYCHHEKWDGSGYPRGLKGETIPLPARLFAVVDVWDALTSDRPYRKAWDRARTIEHLREQSGAHFDPDAVEAFVRMIGENGR